MSQGMERPRPAGTDRGQQTSADERDDVRVAGTDDTYADVGQLTLDDAIEAARRRRDAGQQTAEHGVDIVWRRAAIAAVERLAAAGEEFVIDDVIADVGYPKVGTPNSFGSLMSGAARRGLIRKVGFRQSPRESRQGGYVFVWRGTGGGR